MVAVVGLAIFQIVRVVVGQIWRMLLLMQRRHDGSKYFVCWWSIWDRIKISCALLPVDKTYLKLVVGLAILQIVHMVTEQICRFPWRFQRHYVCILSHFQVALFKIKSKLAVLHLLSLQPTCIWLLVWLFFRLFTLWQNKSVASHGAAAAMMEIKIPLQLYKFQIKSKYFSYCP